MIDMDRQKAFAVLGLPDDASSEEIDALVNERRRKLRQRIVFAATAQQRVTSERALSELEVAHVVAMLAPADPEGSPPAGINITLPAGTILDDRYVIRRRLGYGENGAIFVALDLSWGKEVALKIIRPELLLVPGTYERLHDCVQKVYSLAHSGVVSVYGLSKIDGHVVIAMELLSERNLRAMMREETAVTSGGRPAGLPRAHVVDVVQDICTALDYARQNTLHLNLKPDNVIVTDDGFVKLTDFGLDPILGAALKVTSPTAREQRRYRAPEVARQSETGTAGTIPVDERADQFSVAAIAHYLLLAAAPYPDPSAMALRHRGLSKETADVLSRALSSEPRERFATVSEFTAAFRRAGKNRVSRRVIATTAGFAALAVAVFASAAALNNSSEGGSVFLSPLLNLIPGLEQAPLPNRDILQLQDRVLELSRVLTDQQNALRRAAIEGRITVRSKAQSLDLAETDSQFAAAESEFIAADLEFQRVSALRDIANPDIFNNPETLNAINLLGLASDHIAEGRFDAARSTLQRAETVLAEKIRDYKQAQDLVSERFNAGDAAKTGRQQSTALLPQDQLRRDWLQASQARRRFAAEIQSKMVTVPGGKFEMGDRAGIGNQTEQPLRVVLVPSFQISAFEVTFGDYALCAADKACAALDGNAGQATLPVSGMSWFDTQSYLTWLSQKTGEDYRLPSEAEWEYAARGGQNTIYPWGVSVERGRANCINCGSAWEGIGAAPVGSFAPSVFGLYDMAGNVWEWTADCWYGDYSGAPAIAIARQGNVLCSDRTLRGGSWDNDAWLARTTYRGRGRADMRHDLYGFRIAKSLN